jgi:hypothetical protein
MDKTERDAFKSLLRQGKALVIEESRQLEENAGEDLLS